VHTVAEGTPRDLSRFSQNLYSIPASLPANNGSTAAPAEFQAVSRVTLSRRQPSMRYHSPCRPAPLLAGHLLLAG